MGGSNSNGIGYIDTDPSLYLINGQNDEYGNVYTGKNNLADFVFDHRFIFVDVEECDHYKIYEWTKSGLKMFASRNYPIYQKEYIGSTYIRNVYDIARTISIGESFSLTSFNCKDWINRFKDVFSVYQ